MEAGMDELQRKCFTAKNVIEKLQEATEQIHQNDELIDCLHHRVSLLEKHLNEAVLAGADTEKQLCEGKWEPKRKDKEFIFVFIFRGSGSCRALKKGPKRRGQTGKKKRRPT